MPALRLSKEGEMDRTLCDLHPLATVPTQSTYAREVRRPSGVGAECNNTGQWQQPKIFIFRNECAL